MSFIAVLSYENDIGPEQCGILMKQCGILIYLYIGNFNLLFLRKKQLKGTK